VTDAIDTTGVTNPAPQAVYQTERWGDSTYTFNALVPAASYNVRVHWAEISPSVTGIGDRRFHLTINGTQVLTNFDIYAAAGAKFKAVTREFAVSATGSGQITLQFSQGAQNEAKVGGIEIRPVLPRLVCSPALTNGNVTLTWPTFPGKSYRVEYKNLLTTPGWSILGSDLLAQSNSLSITTSTAGIPRRFYRIRQLN
jgi:hypothetical protein